MNEPQKEVGVGHLIERCLCESMSGCHFCNCGWRRVMYARREDGEYSARDGALTVTVPRDSLPSLITQMKSEVDYLEFVQEHDFDPLGLATPSPSDEIVIKEVWEALYVVRDNGLLSLESARRKAVFATVGGEPVSVSSEVSRATEWVSVSDLDPCVLDYFDIGDEELFDSDMPPENRIMSTGDALIATSACDINEKLYPITRTTFPQGSRSARAHERIQIMREYMPPEAGGTRKGDV